MKKSPITFRCYEFNSDMQHGWVIRTSYKKDSVYIDYASPVRAELPVDRAAWENYAWPSIVKLKLLGVEIYIPDKILPK